MRSSSRQLTSNPVLVGAVTLLVILVAMFLAYNANKGLPFVPTYTVRAELQSGANLTVGNEVRIGGSRVGQVSALDVKRVPGKPGRIIAIAEMKLDQTAKGLPADTAVFVRPKSALGLKYIQLTKGTSDREIADGGLLPLANARPEPVEFDEVASTFDETTRRNGQRNLEGFGDALAGRGSSINLFVGAIGPLLRDVQPVLRNVSDPDTKLPRLINELGDAARVVAPVAEEQASLIRNLDTTFAALREVNPSIQETISEGPATLDQATTSLPRIRPLLDETGTLFRELRPGIASLRENAPTITSAFVTGTPTLRRITALNRRLRPLLRSVQRFAEDPVVPRAINRLDETVRTLRPTLAFLKPAQVTCNYVSLFLRNASSHLSLGDANGTAQRFIIISTPQGPNSETGFASAPANGPTEENRLHSNPYPNTASPGQPLECESGNETYDVGKQTIGNDPGTTGLITDEQPPGSPTGEISR